MSLLLALTAASGGVVADLSVTDANDALAAGALVGVACALSVTDASDTLSATATIEDAAIVSLGGRNKLFDVPSRRVHVKASVADDSDRLHSTARVIQPQVVVAKIATMARLFVTDHADTLSASAVRTWPDRFLITVPKVKMITVPKVKMVSSRYEEATT